jgi:A/G-specific adenine glycosylase
LQKAAKQIVFNFDGEFPDDIKTLQTLAGVGAYTAGAIASIAFGKRAAAVDGNVLRVVSRLLENPTPINDIAYRKKLEETLTDIYPPEGETCARFTQSLFELGALICKPRSPECTACPLSALCQANRHSTQALFPVQPVKKAKREEDVYVFLIQTDGGFCIRRRENGVLKGMNEFPSKVTDGESPSAVLDEWGIYDYQEIKRKRFTHIFTHIRWDITCIWIRTASAPFDTYTIEEIRENISLPTAFKQCLQTIE